ncbi:MAG: STAS domain-containing protein [Phycisphaerae bacterium]
MNQQGQNNSTQLEIDIEERGRATVIAVRGSAGMEDADRLRAALEELAERKVPVIVLELSGMDFICSLGLGAIINGHLKSRHHQGQIRLVNPQKSIRDLLETTRLTRLFPIFSNVDQAIAG